MQAHCLPQTTQDRFVIEVATLAKRTRKSPDLVANDELADFLQGRKRELAPSEYTLAQAAIEFFVTQTLGRTWTIPDQSPARGTPLRQRMIQDMRLRNLAPRTQEEYLRWTIKFSVFSGQSPAKLGPEDVRKWLVHLLEVEKKSVSTYKVAAAALRFLYVKTLQQTWALDFIPLPKRERHLPDILSQEEILEMLAVEVTLLERVIFSATYAGGLRTTEVTRLKVADIDSKRMVIKIVQGKGRKDRYVALSKRLLQYLREYWRAHRPTTWLFPRPDGLAPISADAVRRIVKRIARAAGSTKNVTPRTLRHCFATHQLERGEQLPKIQLAMGHRSLRTTAIYTRIATSAVCAMESPLDWLPQLPE
jgi:site-specific recombinase XerD